MENHNLHRCPLCLHLPSPGAKSHGHQQGFVHLGEKRWSLARFVGTVTLGVVIRTALHENAEEKKQERILLQDEVEEGLESIVGSPR